MSKKLETVDSLYTANADAKGLEKDLDRKTFDSSSLNSNQQMDKSAKYRQILESGEHISC